MASSGYDRFLLGLPGAQNNELSKVQSFNTERL